MKFEKREGNFLGREEREVGRGNWKVTLREDEEVVLEAFLRT
jgi:hypothetical protein